VEGKPAEQGWQLHHLFEGQYSSAHNGQDLSLPYRSGGEDAATLAAYLSEFQVRVLTGTVYED